MELILSRGDKEEVADRHEQQRHRIRGELKTKSEGRGLGQEGCNATAPARSIASRKRAASQVNLATAREFPSLIASTALMRTDRSCRASLSTSMIVSLCSIVKLKATSMPCPRPV
jgi:hypothetical protein